MFATDFIALQEMISEQMHRMRFTNLLWGKVMGRVIMHEQFMNGQYHYTGIPSGQIVEKQEFVIAGGKDTIMIPMITELEQAPGYGDQYLVGTGEDIDFKYAKTAVNQVSAVIKLKDGNMSRMRDMAALKSYKYHMNLLNNRMSVFDNGHIIGSIYEQHSNNVLAGLSISPSGIGMTGHLHPNMYVNQIATDGSSGSLLAVGTEKINKTAAEVYAEVYTDHASMTKPSVYTLIAIAKKVEELKIKPVQMGKNGTPKYLLVVDTDTFYTLRFDTTINAAILAAYTGGKTYESPIFGFDSFEYDKFIVIRDSLTARSFDTTTSTFGGSTGRFYDAPTLPSSYENSTMVLLGASAIGIAIPGSAGRLHFEDEITNFKQNEERAGLSIYGACRTDWVDEDRVATYYAKKLANKTIGGAETSEVLNQSSMLILVLRNAA